MVIFWGAQRSNLLPATEWSIPDSHVTPCNKKGNEETISGDLFLLLHRGRRAGKCLDEWFNTTMQMLNQSIKVVDFWHVDKVERWTMNQTFRAFHCVGGQRRCCCRCVYFGQRGSIFRCRASCRVPASSYFHSAATRTKMIQCLKGPHRPVRSSVAKRQQLFTDLPPLLLLLPPLCFLVRCRLVIQSVKWLSLLKIIRMLMIERFWWASIIERDCWRCLWFVVVIRCSSTAIEEPVDEGGGVKVDAGNSRADEEPVTKSHIRSLVHDPASGGWAPAMIQKYRPIHQLVPIESKRLPTYRLFMRDTPRPTTQNQQVQRRE